MKSPEEQRDEDEREFLRRKALFEPMLKTPAWIELEQILLSQYASMLQDVLSPPQVRGESIPDGMAHALRSEYLKGVVFGIQLTLKTPRGTIASANEIIADRLEREKGNTDASRSSRPSIDPDGNQLPDGAIVTELGGEH